MNSSLCFPEVQEIICSPKITHWASRPVNKTDKNLLPHRVLYPMRVWRMKGLCISHAEWLCKGGETGIHQQEKKRCHSKLSDVPDIMPSRHLFPLPSLRPICILISNVLMVLFCIHLKLVKQFMCKLVMIKFQNIFTVTLTFKCICSYLLCTLYNLFFYKLYLYIVICRADDVWKYWTSINWC